MFTSTTPKFPAGSAAILAIGLLALAPAAASAESHPTTVTKLDDDPAMVRSYWTPARLQAAKPAAVPVASGAGMPVKRAASRIGKPVGASSARLPRTASGIANPTLRLAGSQRAPAVSGLELPWTIRSYGYTSATAPTGRLFFTTPTHDSTCSASVVAVNVILTALHCVQGNRNFRFTPGVYGSRQPYGSFTARSLTHPSSFSYSKDYAFITLNRNASGYDVGQYTKWYELWPNAPKQDVYVLGYPSEGRWGTYANYPYHCSSPVQRYTRYTDGNYDVGLSCYNTGGSSGGPWFQTYRGVPYITSVMSHMGVVKYQQSSCQVSGCPRYGHSFFGPYLGTQAVRDLAQAKQQ